MGLLSILGVVFIVLKLIGTIDWSWFWVLSPFIAHAVIWILAFVIFYFNTSKY